MDSKQLVRLAWQRAESARQRVYLTCLRLVSQAPEESRQSVAEEYLDSVIAAIDNAKR